MTDFDAIQAMPFGINSDDANKAREILQSFDWNTYNKILFVSAALFQVNETELMNMRQIDRATVSSRHFYWYAIYHIMNKSIGEISKLLNIDRVTVSYGIKSTERKIKNNKSIAEKWEMLQKMV